MSAKVENSLGKIGLGMAVAGVVLGLFFLFALGMSDSPQQAQRVFIALPVPAVGFVLSGASLVAAYRRRNVRACLIVSLPGLIISAGMILLTVAAWRSYK
jgi:hypothetical protein